MATRPAVRDAKLPFWRVAGDERGRFGRRAFLIGAGGLTLSLPYLNVFGSRACAQAGGLPGGPRRLLLFFHHQGTVLRQWALPGSSETSFTLGEVMTPLERHRDRLMFLYGIDNKIADLNLSNGHNSSARSCLTAQLYSTALDASGRYIERDAQTVDNAPANGPSIDQVLAQRMQGDLPYRSVDLAVGNQDGEGQMLFAGRNDPVRSEPSPQRALDRFFVTDDGSAEEMRRLRLRKQSVLDAVLSSFAALRARVGAEDRARLDAHADKVRDIERRVLAPANVTCARPVLDLPADFDEARDDWTSAPAQMDLLVMALSCNVAPVGSLVFANAHAPFEWLTYDDRGVARPVVAPGYDNWHDMVHRGKGIDGGMRDEPGLVRGYQWYSEQFAYLLDRMEATPEDDGTMLDHTLVLWMSEFGDGDGHNTLKLHVVLAGNAGSSRGMGRFLDLSGGAGAWMPSATSTNQLFVTVLQAFGYDDTTFGWQADGVEPGALPGVL